jgi:hypothetical protein
MNTRFAFSSLATTFLAASIAAPGCLRPEPEENIALDREALEGDDEPVAIYGARRLDRRGEEGGTFVWEPGAGGAGAGDLGAGGIITWAPGTGGAGAWDPGAGGTFTWAPGEGGTFTWEPGAGGAGAWDSGAGGFTYEPGTGGAGAWEPGTGGAGAWDPGAGAAPPAPPPPPPPAEVQLCGAGTMPTTSQPSMATFPSAVRCEFGPIEINCNAVAPVVQNPVQAALQAAADRICNDSVVYCGTKKAPSSTTAELKNDPNNNKVLVVQCKWKF